MPKLCDKTNFTSNTMLQSAFFLIESCVAKNWGWCLSVRKTLHIPAVWTSFWAALLRFGSFQASGHMSSLGTELLAHREKFWRGASSQYTTLEVKWDYLWSLAMKIEGCTECTEHVCFFSQQCPAISSLSSPSSRWLFRLFLANTKTRSECQISSFDFIGSLVDLCTDFFFFFFWYGLRDWFLNGNYLIIIVSAAIILPLTLMKQLGMISHPVITSRPPPHPCWLSHLPRNCTVFVIIINVHVQSCVPLQVIWDILVASRFLAWCFSSFRWVCWKQISY